MPEPITVRGEVLEALSDGGPMYPEEMAEVTGLDKTVQNTLSELRKGSLVTNTGERRGRTHQVALHPRDSHLMKGTGTQGARLVCLSVYSRPPLPFESISAERWRSL
jgi:DNA-binding transcriptional ArsR family regulator